MGGAFSSTPDWSKEYLAGYGPQKSGDLSFVEMKRTISQVDTKAMQKIFDKFRRSPGLFRLYQFLRHPKGVGNEYVLFKLRPEDVDTHLVQRYEEIFRLWNRLPMNLELFKLWTTKGWPAVKVLLDLQAKGADDSTLYEAFP
jgi:hypothetical protein